MRHIKTKMMVYVSLSILIITITLTTIAYFAFKNLMIDELEQSLELMTIESAELVGRILESNLDPLAYFARSKSFHSLSIKEQVAMISEIDLSFYEGLAIVDLEGFAHYTDGAILDLSDREYIINALRGEVNYSELLLSRKVYVPVVMGAIPIVNNDDQVTGAVIARIKIQEINELISKRGYGDNGFAYIIDGSGYFIYNGDEQSFQENISVFDTSLVNTTNEDFSKFIKDSRLEDHGVGQYKKDKKKVWMGFESISNTNWKIYIGTLENDILLGLNRLKNTFIILNVLIVVMIMPITNVLTKKLTRPILKLDEAFSKATSGDLGVRVNIDTKDEIQRAGENFNQMMDYINTLTYDDPITQLPNLSVFEKKLKSIAQKDSRAHDFTLMLVTVNGFDKVYENFDYAYGYSLLREIAEQLNILVHLQAKVYKGRAEDFLVFFEKNMPFKHVNFLADEIIATLIALRNREGKKLSFDISIGIDFVRDTKTIVLEPLLAPIIHARNTARENGINQICIYNESSYRKKKEIQSIEEDLIEAIEENAFHMVYQPVYNILTGKLSGAEALIRWNNRNKEMIPPDVFIPLAEKLQVVNHIDYWVIDHVFADYKMMGQPFLMSVNITSQSFEREDFVEYISNRLRKYEIGQGMIQLELTERVLVKDINGTVNKLLQLKKLGVKIAIDDFGVGYSSFNYILQLPIDCIKIDRSFIKDIINNKNAKVIVSNIVSMSKALNLKTVAEGVETVEIVDELRKLKCDDVQGYFYNKPLSLSEFHKIF